MAVISREDMDGHVEAHAICRARRTTAVNAANRDSRSEVYDIDAGRLKRLFRQIPVGNEADLVKAQSRGERHALTSDVAANGQHRRECISTMCDRVGAGPKKMAKEIRPVVDIDQNVRQVGLWESQLDEFFETLDGIRLVQGFQGREVEFVLVGINGECLVLWNAPVHVGRYLFQVIVQPGE